MTALTVAAACLPAASAQAATYPSGFEEDTIVGGLTIPTTAAWAPDGRIFIAEKSGLLKVVNPGFSTATTILDISDKVNDSYDRGLLGLALDSDFESNGYVYLLYVYDVAPLMPDSDGQMVSRLSRIQVSGSNTVSAETVLLGTYVAGPCPAPSNTVDCIPAEGRSHAIGTVISAPDGTLYVGSGDASSYAEFDPLAFRVYDDQSFAGKLMHVDRDGRGLPGHAFCPADANLDHVCTKLHSKGFRNPFRFELRGDGSLAIGDVGWSTREEVDFISTPGGSYGWPCYEGTIHTPIYQDDDRCDGPSGEYAKEGTPQAHRPPVYDYNHTATNAIIGGPIYPSGDYPDEYDGNMFFGDFAAGFMKVLDLDAGGAVTGTTDFANGWAGTDLMLTPDGDLAFTDFGTGEPGSGSLKAIVYAPAAGSPNAVATADPEAGGKPLTVNFSSAGSSDPEHQPLSYDWDFDDGSAHSSAAAPSHVYTDAGVYHPTLTVDDGDGHTDSVGLTVNVFNSPPTPQITSPADESSFRDGDVITLHGSATDAEDGALSASALSWRVILHHGAHTHQAGTFNGTASPTFTAQRDHDADSYYEVRLRATDSDAEFRQTTIELRPETAPFQILSSPPGAPVAYGGVGRTAPFSTTSAIGLQTSVSAGARFSAGGEIYHFHSWADGGGRVRQVEIPATASSVTAVYHEDKAFGQPATATSVQGDDPAFAASKATDDNPATRWSSKGQAPGLDPSPAWQVDLGSVRPVSAIELDWETAYASRYDVLTSVDGTHWSLAASEAIGGAIKHKTSFPLRRARYVKVAVLEHGTSFGVSFYEARVLGPQDSDPVPEDKAARRPASASSSQLGSFGPSLAVDEDSATRWSSNSLDNQWLQIDLGSPRSVDTVELNWEAAYASQYLIETSLDGMSFSTAATVNIAEPGLERTGFTPQEARYVRITGLQRATLFGISLWDARVYGPADSTPDSTPPDTQITAGPSGSTTSSSATFEFNSEPGTTFECSLDGAAFAGCASPRSYSGLAVGAHSFGVRARDGAGNVDASPAERSWTVTAPEPVPSARSYADVIRGAAKLLGYWPLAGRADALIRPSSDGARSFDGRDDRVSAPARAIGRPKSLTVELWLKPARAGGKRGRVLIGRVLTSLARASLEDGFTLLLDRRQRAVFALDGKRGRQGSVTGPALRAGRVYHLVATYDGRTLVIYVNGRRSASRRYTGGIDWARGRALRFGGPSGRPTALAFFAGVLDEAAVYGQALGAATVSDHFRVGTGSG